LPNPLGPIIYWVQFSKIDTAIAGLMQLERINAAQKFEMFGSQNLGNPKKRESDLFRAQTFVSTLTDS
jgi:hypothetical protein